jgi:uncharacterized protein (DUF433 family)
LGGDGELQAERGIFERTVSTPHVAMSPSPTPVVHSDRDILGGLPIFVGTRVRFQALIDYLEGGHPLDEFLEDFPSVNRERAIAAFDFTRDAMLDRV